MIYSDYKSIRHVAVTYYKDHNMCTVIALAVAAGIGYGKAYHTYRRLGRRAGTGTRFPMQQAALAEHGLKMVYCDLLRPRTVNQAEQALKGTQGIYMVYSTGHVSAVYDGVCYDWAAGGSRKRVTGIYKVVPA